MIDRKLQLITRDIVGNKKDLFRLEASFLQEKDFTWRHGIGIHPFSSCDGQQMQVAVGIDRIVGCKVLISNQLLHVAAALAENGFVVDIERAAETLDEFIRAIAGKEVRTCKKRLSFHGMPPVFVTS